MEKEKVTLEEGQRAYEVTYLSSAVRQGISQKTNKPYNLGFIKFHVELLDKDKKPYKKEVEIICAPEDVPQGLEDYSKVTAVFALPDDPTRTPIFVKIVK